MIWLVFALMTGAAMFCALWPLSRRRRDAEGEARTVAFYKAQLLEIGRDVERGQLPQADAEGARIEAARRLIAASERAGGELGVEAGATFRRRAAALIILIGAPLITLGLYGRLGSPDLPDEPIVARLADPARSASLEAAVAKIEEHLMAHPEDGRGYAVVAPAYMRLARFDDAARAFNRALTLLGDKPGLRADYGEALVAAADGIVTADARVAFQRALSAQPGLPKARYYMALAAEQGGDKARAADLYAKLLADGPTTAAWAPVVRARLDALKGAPAPGAKTAAPPAGEAAAIASLAPAQREAAIRGMVDRLAARLQANTDDPAGWSRLIRAYSVLHETDKAKAALLRARDALSRNEPARRELDALARELGLEG